jgi:hypothetical protein
MLTYIRLDSLGQQLEIDAQSTNNCFLLLSGYYIIYVVNRQVQSPGQHPPPKNAKDAPTIPRSTTGSNQITG